MEGTSSKGMWAAALAAAVLGGCAAQPVDAATATLCERAAEVAEGCGETIEDGFWDRCFAEPEIAEAVVAGGCEPGKGDWFGNRTENEGCWWDWQCSSDEGLVCRPADKFLENHVCQPAGTEYREIDGRGSYRLFCGDMCDENQDCASGTVCVGLRDGSVLSSRGEMAGMCLQPTHAAAPHTACGR